MKKSLATRVLAFLKGGDEAKLVRFESKLDKYFKKQISMREDEIETLTEKIVDVTERLNEVVLNVNLDRVNATEGAEGYCPTYVTGVQRQMKVIEELKEQIEAKQAEIDFFKETQAVIEKASNSEAAKA